MLDTNVVIRALLSRNSPSFKLFELAEEHFYLFSSQTALKELGEKLMLPRISRRFETPAEIETSVRLYTSIVTLVEPEHTIRVCRDPDDDHFLALALASGAEWILSYDDDLLVLDPFRHGDASVSIVRPEHFLARVQL